MLRKNIILAFLPLALAGNAFAGKGTNKPDTLQGYKLFTSLSRDWQKPPLQLKVSVSNSSNMAVSASDTAFQEGAFYLKEKAAYIRFGDMEQLLDDSTALMVSHGMRRMVLFSGAGQLADKMRDMMSTPASMASIEAMAKKYRVAVGEGQGDTGNISLFSRALVPGTDIPLEQVGMQYDAVTSIPIMVTSIRRTAIPLEPQEYTQVHQEKPELGANLIDEGTGKYWLLKENKSTFKYLGLGHDPDIALPAIISDRLLKKNDSYKPAAGYENYSVALDTP